jgi:hypothetical protein
VSKIGKKSAAHGERFAQQTLSATLPLNVPSEKGLSYILPFSIYSIQKLLPLINRNGELGNRLPN